MITSSKVTF